MRIITEKNGIKMEPTQKENVAIVFDAIVYATISTLNFHLDMETK